MDRHYWFQHILTVTVRYNNFKKKGDLLGCKSAMHTFHPWAFSFWRIFLVLSTNREQVPPLGLPYKQKFYTNDKIYSGCVLD